MHPHTMLQVWLRDRATLRRAIRVGTVWLAAAIGCWLAATQCSQASVRPKAQQQAEVATRLTWTGVNFSGAEFNPARLPGRANKDYVYPTPAVAAPFVAAGFNSARLPVRWERLQPVAFGPLDPDQIALLDQAVSALSGFGLIIVDVHNYDRFHGELMQPANDGGSKLADLWAKLAVHFRNKPRIAFGLMNEPNGVAAGDWAVMAQASINAIRTAGAKQLVLVPGTRWSGAHSWTAGGADANSKALAGIHDPADNIAIEMHQYLDRDSSGTHPECVTPDVAVSRLRSAQNWLKAVHRRGFLAEFGVPSTPECADALDAMLTSMEHAPDVWLGWTYWAAGAWLGKYPMRIQPDLTGGTFQMAILRRHLSGTSK